VFLRLTQEEPLTGSAALEPPPDGEAIPEEVQR
jgi:hypothetical protein